MIYLHLDVAWIASQASSMCVLCVQYLHDVCGVSLCVRLNAPGGVVSVLFDSLICSLLPLSLVSPVLSWLLFIVPASSPQQCQTS